MEKELFAVCPKCGRRAAVLSTRWDWDAQQDFARVKCVCGLHEVPFDANRIVDIDLNNPYMNVTHFRLLIPVGMDRDGMWNRIGGCLMQSWTQDG